jgi:hypothetical protein
MQNISDCDNCCSGCRKPYKSTDTKLERTALLGVSSNFHPDCRPNEEEWKRFIDLCQVELFKMASTHVFPNKEAELARLKKENEEQAELIRELQKEKRDLETTCREVIAQGQHDFKQLKSTIEAQDDLLKESKKRKLHK